MFPTVNASDIESLAQDVVEAAEGLDRRLYPKAWNWRMNKNCSWYLNPTADWPAFRFGKALLRSEQGHLGRQPTSLFSCFFVEKGPDVKLAAEAYPAAYRRGYLSDKTWLWWDFLAALASGEVNSIVEQVGRKSSQPVVLEIAVSTLSETVVAEGTGNPWSLREYVRFRVDGPVLVPLHSASGDMLQSVAELSYLEEIPHALRNNKDLAWFWLDIYIGVDLSLGSAVESNSAAWNGAAVWQRTLRPWLSWIR